MVASSLQHDTTLQTLEAILRYLMSVSSTITRDQLRASYTRGVSEQPLLTKGLSIMPTIAEQLIQEGFEQGLAEARAEVLAKQLAEGALVGRIHTLAEFLGQSVGSIEELLARDEAELRQLAEELKAAVDRRLIAATPNTSLLNRR